LLRRQDLLQYQMIATRIRLVTSFALLKYGQAAQMKWQTLDHELHSIFLPTSDLLPPLTTW
jgi:hypothetical protein